MIRRHTFQTAKGDVNQSSMVRISDPVRIKVPKLREFAFRAAWIATATAAATELEELLVDVPPTERALPDFSTPWPWEFDSVAVALTVLRHERDGAKQSLEDALARWLGEHPEHWQLLWFLIGPWQERPAIWADDTPDWMRTLGTIGARAYSRYKPTVRGPDHSEDPRD
jgi:hypothetical protein